MTEQLRPYSHPNYSKNARKVKGNAWPCVHCGKPIKESRMRFGVEVYDGGAAYARETVTPRLCDPKFAAGYEGFQPVGPECKKLLEADGVIISKWYGDGDDFPEPTVNVPGFGWMVI